VTELGEPLRIGPVTARNRLVFGPHETNLARRRSISERHVAYYRARALGGVGTIVTEEASVHSSDWPYERSPLAAECAEGWEAVATACHEEGALVLASLGHAGGQGSSAYHQRALWGPSRSPDVVTREVPQAMELEEIEELLEGFAAAACLARDAGCDGVELNAGQWSLLRQFASGLTNHREDELGEDRGRLIELALARVRQSVPDAVVGLRMSCDELAPWAGVVPEAAGELLARLAAERPGGRLFDYVTVVRGSAYATAATRPDGHVEPGFNRLLAQLVRSLLPAAVAVVGQGSIVDAEMARAVVERGEADAVEATRAQIADPSFASKALGGEDRLIRPCLLCNQLCQVRDVRNPIVSCVAEPRSGHETEDPDPDACWTGIDARAPRELSVLVVGGGPAGLECARVAARAGAKVRLLERREVLGGMLGWAAARVPGRERLALLTSFLEDECRRAGVEIVTGHEATVEELDAHEGPAVVCTGSRAGRRTYEVLEPGTAIAAADLLSAEGGPRQGGLGASVVWDPVGGPVGVGVAELLAGQRQAVALVTPDFVAGEQLSRTGDLAAANVRLARAGVEVVRHAVVRVVDGDGVTVEDRFSGARRRIPASLLVDAGHRLPEDGLARALKAGRPPDVPILLAGDAVAPRTAHEAVLEGRRAALGLLRAGGQLRAAVGAGSS
jgi:mycofactocin system FadH/OYE family oxidoreductase 1